MSGPVVDSWYAAIRAGDAEALAAATTDDVELLWNGDPALIPWAGLHVGRDAVLRFFTTVLAHLDVAAVETLDRIDGDGGTTILGRGRWRVKATGVEVNVRMANVFRFRDGRVSAYHVYGDSAAFAVALGTLVPAVSTPEAR